MAGFKSAVDWIVAEAMAVQQAQQLLGDFQAALGASQLECYRLARNNQMLQEVRNTLSDYLAKQLAESEKITREFEELAKVLLADLEEKQRVIRELYAEREQHLAAIQNFQNQLRQAHATIGQPGFEPAGPLRGKEFQLALPQSEGAKGHAASIASEPSKKQPGKKRKISA
ncbi:hypothetical protein DL771_009555 [Monosporascus sp. 5C6A]|nr:hypothetical protein DL771_009555 [Monosporascus sp. 5C6A]